MARLGRAEDQPRVIRAGAGASVKEGASTLQAKGEAHRSQPVGSGGASVDSLPTGSLRLEAAEGGLAVELELEVVGDLLGLLAAHLGLDVEVPAEQVVGPLLAEVQR